MLQGYFLFFHLFSKVFYLNSAYQSGQLPVQISIKNTLTINKIEHYAVVKIILSKSVQKFSQKMQ